MYCNIRIGCRLEYIGDWLDGRRHSFGVLTTPEGDSVTGEWEQDALSDGKYLYADGSIYQGQFKNGKRHGEGTLTSPDGSTYHGQWKDDYPHGQGTWTTRDVKYVGGWKNGLWHGQGTMIFYDGTVLSGIWINGECTGIYPDKAPPPLRYWGN
ncbi:MORN repeat-containing protein [Tenuifilum sp.]|uniref:MORN repeat-containing protein n=1 Tax=Tenuifilum sp. TaxID=2760880 RepID=UPI00403EBC5A